jgi:amino acid adenylation domain-containing protein
MTFPLDNSMTEAQRDDGAVSVLSQPPKAWGEARTAYPRDKTIAQLFEEIADANAGRTALVCGSTEITYSELNSRANRLANELRRLGVGPERMVGCYVERSTDAIVAFLGILKAGGAYVPLDPSYPKERLEIMWREICAPVVITQRSLTASIDQPHVPRLFVDEVSTEAGVISQEKPPAAGTATTLAYVMYTSGSTGQPKGVMVENRAVVRLVRNTNFCNFGPEETFLQFAPLSFDASTLEIWGPLLNGGKLVLMPPGAASLEDLGRTVREQRITTLWLTAGLFNVMVEQRLEDLRPIRQLLAGGDVLSAGHVRKVLESFPGIRVINGYGPTENTTFTCCHVMRAGDSVPESVPIGRPISNTCVYILDENLSPVPMGTPGELFAGGDGVARGYLNDSERTAEKFLRDPFADESNARMYRTGDLVRWRQDGVVEFLGRLDNQVKILGYRIEPGEIEIVIRAHRGVSQACVVPHTDTSGSKRLVAYFTATGTTGVSGQDLKRFLSAKIPSYMVPAIFLQVDSFPLSPNGKVDRAALPAPPAASEGSATGNGSANGIEQEILAVWKRILRLKQVGLDDNFFDVGGDSLLIIAVQANLQKTLQREIPITDLFEFTTVRALGAHLGKPQSKGPSFAGAEQQAQKQRDAFARERERRKGGLS